MISPQKFSKALGNRRLKIGLSIKELVLCSFIPTGLNLLGLEPFVALMAFVATILALALKNKVLAPKYIQNAIEKKTHMKWEKINVNRN